MQVCVHILEGSEGTASREQTGGEVLEAKSSVTWEARRERSESNSEEVVPRLEAKRAK